MPLQIELPPQAQAALESQASRLGLTAERDAARLLTDHLGVEPAEASSGESVRTAADIVLRHMANVPDEFMAQMPRDGASEHDRYIYGAPKRGS